MRFRLRDILLLMLMVAVYVTSIKFVQTVIVELGVGKGIYAVQALVALVSLAHRTETGHLSQADFGPSILKWHEPMPWVAKLCSSLSLVTWAWLTRYFNSFVGLAIFLLVSIPFLFGFVDLFFHRQVILHGNGIVFRNTFYPWSRIDNLEGSNGKVVRLALRNTQSRCVVSVPQCYRREVTDLIKRYS